MRKLIAHLSDGCTCYAQDDKLTIKFEHRTLRVFTKSPTCRDGHTQAHGPSEFNSFLMQPQTDNTTWIQVLDTQDMDQHALAQQGWALQYEQLSPGQFKGRIHQVQLPEVTLLREDTSIALRQRGRLDDSVYGFAMALEDSSDLFFNGQRVPAHAIMCGKGDEVDLTSPPNFTLIAVVVEKLAQSFVGAHVPKALGPLA
jgi:hypothetical protein